MKRNVFVSLATMFASIFLLSAFHPAQAQTNSPRFAFRAGQSMYIVAYRRVVPSVLVDSVEVTQPRQEYFDNALDVEKKVREKIEEWKFFRVADKPSDADFIFLVNLDETAIEGLVLPFDAYRQHFKDKYDLDALRDAAYGRYLAGPLKLPTLSRLSDRLIKQFRESVATGNATVK